VVSRLLLVYRSTVSPCFGRAARLRQLVGEFRWGVVGSATRTSVERGSHKHGPSRAGVRRNPSPSQEISFPIHPNDVWWRKRGTSRGYVRVKVRSYSYPRESCIEYTLHDAPTLTSCPQFTSIVPIPHVEFSAWLPKPGQDGWRCPTQPPELPPPPPRTLKVVSREKEFLCEIWLVNGELRRIW